MRLALVLTHDEIAELQTSIVVEGWDKRLSGKVKRQWLKEFTEEERSKAGYLYSLFYVWYLVKGIPQEHIFRSPTIPLIHKLVKFFGTI